MGLFWAIFYTRFQVGFQASFSYLSKRFSPLVLEIILPYQKERFFKSVLKKRFLQFSPQIQSLFSHTYLSFPLLYQSYMKVVVRVFLGDQSVEITKVFHLVFEEANLRVRDISSSCGSSV